MGSFEYAGSVVSMDDRALAHMQAVIGAKFQRKESFFFSWTHSRGKGSGRVSVWMHPAIPAVFSYDSVGRVPLSREWLLALMDLANSAPGLSYVAEPVQGTLPTDSGVRAVSPVGRGSGAASDRRQRR